MNTPLIGAIQEDALKLRELAAWYRKFAECAGNPVIWESRVLLAEDLEREAARIEFELKPQRVNR